MILFIRLAQNSDWRGVKIWTTHIKKNASRPQNHWKYKLPDKVGEACNCFIDSCTWDTDCCGTAQKPWGTLHTVYEVNPRPSKYMWLFCLCLTSWLLCQASLWLHLYYVNCSSKNCSSKNCLKVSSKLIIITRNCHWLHCRYHRLALIHSTTGSEGACQPFL